jgi:hypothetical protein
MRPPLLRAIATNAVGRVYAVPSRHRQQIDFSYGGTAWSELNKFSFNPPTADERCNHDCQGSCRIISEE